LQSQGIFFRTSGDTEVLLAAYRHCGEDCLKRLNGMWAFAIWDRRRGAGRERLFVIRDRAGEKPFYYSWHAGGFEFASELKALRTSGGLDLQALNHYLALGYVPGDLCLAAGVMKLPPAHAGVFDLAGRVSHLAQLAVAAAQDGQPPSPLWRGTGRSGLVAAHLLGSSAPAQ
jgi:asparagine synthase (glutamine-hydrolysing)